MDAIVDFECPEDFTGGVKSVCAAAKNVAVLVIRIVLIITETVSTVLPQETAVASTVLLCYANALLNHFGTALIVGCDLELYIWRACGTG